MQRLEVSCAERHIYIYVVKRQRVKGLNHHTFCLVSDIFISFYNFNILKTLCFMSLKIDT